MENKIDLRDILKDEADDAEPVIPQSALMTANRTVQYIDRGWYIALEFELSSSAKFETALALARQNPHFAELVDERGVSIYRTIYFKDLFPKFNELYGIVGGWKNTRFYFKGHEIRQTDFEIWYPCFLTYWGHRRSLNITDYCGQSKISLFPDFIGCYDRNIYLRWRDPLTVHYHSLSRMWYSFGKRTTEGFQLDKTAMQHFLKSMNRDYHTCPSYGHHMIEQVIHKLPNMISVSDRKTWLYKEDYLRLNERQSMMFHHEIALSVLPDVCPASEKVYHKFMEQCFRAGL